MLQMNEAMRGSKGARPDNYERMSLSLLFSPDQNSPHE